MTNPFTSKWYPTDVIVQNWGRIALSVGGKDVTYYRDIPTKVQSFSFREPFDDANCVLVFPQITPFEPLPSWLKAGSLVTLKRVPPSGSRSTLWEGMVVSWDDSGGAEANGLSVQCIGALYQLDFYLRQPNLTRSLLTDISNHLKDIISPRARFKGALRFRTITGPTTGIKIYPSGSWQPTLTGYVQDILSKAWIEDGSNQWTVMMKPGRQPTLQLKNHPQTGTVKWTVHIGTPGVEHSFTQDYTTATTTVFGEGVDLKNCRWRNAKYPNLRYDDAPVWFGNTISPGDTSQDDKMLLFEEEMFAAGWTGFNRNGDYDLSEETWVRQFQDEAGIQVDGIIGPQTWAAAFNTGENAGDLTGSYMAPLYSKKYTEQHFRDAHGARTGDNPDFDKTRLRVERHEHFGQQVTKSEGIRSAKVEVERDFNPGYVGRLTLTTDPEEGSRFGIRAGDNIKVRGLRGSDHVFHIAEASVSWQDQLSVGLVVDEEPRDYMTIAAILSRDRNNDNPFRRQEPEYRNKSKQTEDRPVWDCENGSGIVPYHATYAELWNVIRIPAGWQGTIVRTEFSTEAPSPFAIGVFDRPVYADQIRPFGKPYEEGFWDNFSEASGLVVGWGGEGQMAGYSPGTESDGDALTGKLIDNSQWYYESNFEPPWLWVAIWVEVGGALDPGDQNVNYIKGRLFQSNEAF